MDEMKLALTVESKSGKEQMAFRFNRLVCAGWVGRVKKALQAHMDELAQLGIPGPTRTPTYMNFSRYLVSPFQTVEVITAETSGEVEYVAFVDEKGIYVGVGSDHTDRGFEKHGIDASKQMYAKVIAPVIWPYEEVKDHWDQIIIRSWTTKDGKRVLYQEDPLAEILDLDTLLEKLPRDDGLPADGIVLFSGTIPCKEGLIYGDSFEFEMDDPLLGRRIKHKYDVKVLPQYM
jgi:hypothetical protein